MNDIVLDGDAIARFWDWFAENKSELAKADFSEGLIDELEQRLFEIHELDWEIGPGKLKGVFFALSPRGNPDLLPITRAIIDAAPKLSGWEFFPAKPPRTWNMIFNLETSVDYLEIDGNRWSFLARDLGNRTWNLLFKPHRVEGLEDGDLEWAASIICVGELGEEEMMRLVANIAIVTDWNEHDAWKAEALRPGVLAKVLSGEQTDAEGNPSDIQFCVGKPACLNTTTTVGLQP